VDTLAPPSGSEGKAEPSVLISGVQSPRRVLLGSELRFRVSVRQTGAGGVPLVLIVDEDGKRALSYEFKFGPQEDERQMSVAHRPASVGVKRYSLHVEPKGASTGPKPSHPYELSVKVESRRNEVLLLEDTWRWDFKFLRRVFESDPSFSFTAFISRGPGIYMQFGEPDRRVNLAGYPQTRAELAWFDTIVLGDVKPGRWPKALTSAIHDLVEDEGRSLIVIAGPNIRALAEVPEIDGLLPVEVVGATARPVEGPVAVRLSLEASTSPMFFSPPASGQWSHLPPMDQVYAPLRKRPAATVLVEASDRANEYGNLIVIAEHTVGKGRVLYVGTDTVWKWQMLGVSDDAGNTPYTVFWQQALRALEPGRLSSGNVNLWLEPDRGRYVAGQTVRVRAEVESDRSLASPKVEAKVALPDGTELPLALAPDPARANVFEAEFEASNAGQYRVSGAVRSADKVVADATTAMDVEGATGELAEARIDSANLARLAAATGGQAVVTTDRSTWPDRPQQEEFPVQQRRTVDFWNDFALLIVLTAVMGADWAIRLLRGYV
jgi:hypothetical protein